MATFTNQATLRYNGNVVNSNITTGELVEVLSATKTAVIDSYEPDSDVTYVIQIVNSGNIAFTGLSITDNLGAFSFGTETLVPLDYVNGSTQYYVNGVLQAVPTVTAGPPLVISGINVPANGVATIIYVAKANQFAPLGTEDSITNSAVIDGGGITPITVTETIAPESGARLSITKSICPATVTENGTLTYTFTIINTGNTPAVATDDVTVTDTFNPILTNLVVALDGTTWSTPENYTYDETTGEFSTVPGQIVVPAATYTQDATTGEWIIDPGVVVLTVTGSV